MLPQNVVLPHHIKEVSMHFPRDVVFGDAHCIELPSSAVGNRKSGWQNWWAVEQNCYKRRWDPPWSWWKPSAALPCSLHLDQDPTAAGSEQCAHGLSDSFEIWTWFQIFHFSGKLPLFKINEEFSFYGDTLPKWPLLSNSETFPIFPLITTHNMRQEFLNFQFLLL